jgi:sodium/hydrogen antiporter
MAFAHPLVQRAPITSAIIYLLIGVVLGPWGVGVLNINPVHHSRFLLHASEIAVVVSLFTVGMKLRLPVLDPRLRPAVVLATVSMVITIGLVTAVGAWLLGLSLGAALLLGGMLAPTDPVLASDVQLRHPLDRDKLRLTLSVEGGLNDGTAFPFVVLGLGLMATGDTSTFGWRWLLVDGLWSVLAGIAIGAAVGYGMGRLVLRLNARREKPFAFGEYLVLGIIGVAYGLAAVCHAYGFLAVFAAGVALRAAERRESDGDGKTTAAVSAMAAGHAPHLSALGDHPAPAYFAGALLAINEQLERILEVALVLLVGAMLATVPLTGRALVVAALLFCVIRPLATLPVLAVARLTRFEFWGVAWFGIRGIGSIYYVMYAIQHGLSPGLIEPMLSLVLSVVALSIFVHGISVTPLLKRYGGSSAVPR